VRSLAQPCKDSIYVRSCALRALDSDPAALVIYAGHNDFSGHTGAHPGRLLRGPLARATA
jgi:hypothetical protein